MRKKHAALRLEQSCDLLESFGLKKKMKLANKAIASSPSDPDLEYVIADLGCGIGNLTIHLGKKYPQINFVGVDKSKAMTDRAKKRIVSEENIYFDMGDIAVEEDVDRAVGEGFADEVK